MEAQGTRDAANTKASDILSKAEAEAITIRGRGDAEAAKHYAVFAKHPALANFLRSLKALEQLKRRTTYVLTTGHPPYQLLDPNLVVPGAEPKGAKPTTPPAGRN